MPPRKKSRVNSRANASFVGKNHDLMISTTLPQSEKPTYNILEDPWTDEQETSLFKGIVKWKPAGIHKHFRMIAISEYLRNHGYDPTIEKHTRIPCIWEKLKKLYNLEHIDYNENNLDNQKQNGKTDVFFEFKLPEEDYDEIQFLRGRRSTSEAPSENISSPIDPPQLKHSSSPVVKKKRKRKEIHVKRNTSPVGETGENRFLSNVPILTKSIRRGRPPSGSSGRPKKKVESISGTSSIIVESRDDVDDIDEDEEDEESVLSAKGKISRNNFDPPFVRKSKRKK